MESISVSSNSNISSVLSYDAALVRRLGVGILDSGVDIFPAKYFHADLLNVAGGLKSTVKAESTATFVDAATSGTIDGYYSPVSAPVDPDLQYWWRMEDELGEPGEYLEESKDDSIGMGPVDANDGTSVGGIVDNAVRNNGDAGYVGAGLNLGNGVDRRIAFWHKPTNVVDSSVLFESSNGLRTKYVHIAQGTTNITAKTDDGMGSTGKAIKTVTWNTGTWHFIVLDIRADGTLELYFDNDAATTASGPVIDYADCDDVSFFCGVDGSAKCDGSIDELGIFTSASTSEWRTAIWNAGAGVSYEDATDIWEPDANLLNWYRFQNDLTDSVGGASMELMPGGANGYENGIVGECWQGISMSGAVPEPGSLAMPAGEFQVAFWIDRTDGISSSEIAWVLGEETFTNLITCSVSATKVLKVDGVTAAGEIFSLEMASPLADGWHFVVLSYDGTTGYTLNVNNGETILTDTSAGTEDWTPINVPLIGASFNGTNAVDALQGKLDEWGLFDAVKDTTWIARKYNYGEGAPYQEYKAQTIIVDIDDQPPALVSALRLTTLTSDMDTNAYVSFTFEDSTAATISGRADEVIIIPESMGEKVMGGELTIYIHPDFEDPQQYQPVVGGYAFELLV